jgi:hypothetical protein
LKYQVASSVIAAIASLVILAWPAEGDEPAPQPVSAAALKQKHAALRERLEASPFGRPLVLDSTDAGRQSQGATSTP